MSRLSRIFAFVVVAWTAASPFLWRRALFDIVGGQIPWEFTVQPVALAVLGVLALPGLWLGVRWVAWSVFVAVAVVALSQLAFSSAMPGGLFMNGALLCLVAALALRSAGQNRRQLF